MTTEYKQTPLGKLPKEWKVEKLEDVCVKITDGSHWSPKEVEEGDHRIVTVANLRETYVDLHSCKFISKEDYIRLVKEGDVPEKGDILFSKDGTVGISFSFKQNNQLIGVLSSVAIIRPNPQLLLSDFGAYALKSPNVFRQVIGRKTGTALKRIILNHIKTIRIPLPPLSEQRRIAEILSAIDDAIHRVEKAIAKTGRLKKGLMRKLLTKGIGHKEFKDLPIGRIPENWEYGKLVDFSMTTDNPVQTGPFGAQLHAFDYKNEGVPLILIKNVIDGKIVNEDMPRIAETKASELTRYRLKEGDIVFSRVGSVGRRAVIEKHQEGWLVSGQMLRVRLENPKINNDFLSYAIASRWFQKALASRTVGATRKSINTEILSNLPMVVPPFPEQQKIVEILSTIDKKLELDRKRKKKLERIKKGLMNDLLTGKRRVKVAM